MNIHVIQLQFERSGAIIRKTLDIVPAEKFDPLKYHDPEQFKLVIFADEGQFQTDTASISEDEACQMLKGCSGPVAVVERVG